MSAAGSDLAAHGSPQRSARPGVRELVALPVAALGLATLLARPWLAADGMGPLGFGLLLVLLGAAAIAAPARTALETADPGDVHVGEGGRPAAAAVLPTGAVILMGMAAVVATGLMAGRVPPLSAGFATLGLNVVAGIAEEAFFRRFLYGRLLSYGAPVAIVVSTIVFALVHVPVYGGAVLWVDLGAGLLFGWQRWASGGWAAPAATHVLANLMAVLR